VDGESVQIIKGTGPGAAMAIPSVPKQIALMQAAALEEKENHRKKPSTSSTLGRIYNIKVITSTDKIG
jgi:hypothetical protein